MLSWKIGLYEEQKRFVPSHMDFRLHTTITEFVKH